MRVASVCTVLPTEDAPHHGIFVERRLKALSQLVDLQVLQPRPWFPAFRVRRSPRLIRHNERYSVYQAPMFYLPKVFKARDWQWLNRSIWPVLHEWHRERPIDIIDAHFGYPEGAGALVCAKRLNVPLVITVRGNECEYLRNPAIASRMMRAFRECAHIVAVSGFLKNQIVESGIPAEKVTVVPNGIDHERFFPDDQREARQQLGLPSARRLLVSVGALIPRKGPGRLLRAFSCIAQEIKDVDLAFIGAEPRWSGKGSPRELAEQLGVSQRVTFAGPVEPGRLGNWLRAADLFALPSWREGCCNAVLESLACGTPVVATPVGDNPERVETGKSGYLVPLGDHDSLVDALRLALTRTWDRAAIARPARERDWNVVAQDVVSILNAIRR